MYVSPHLLRPGRTIRPKRIHQRDASLDDRRSSEGYEAALTRTAFLPVLHIDMENECVWSCTNVACTPYVGEESTLRKLLDQVSKRALLNIRAE